MTETAVPQRAWTREDYRRLPEGPPYFELIDGELVEMTRPQREHYEAHRYLIEVLSPYVRQLGGDLAPEPNLYLPGIEEVYHPDLVYVAKARLSICRKDGIHGVPDLICEILSPSTRHTDRYKKMRDFRRCGVPYVWLVEPEGKVGVEEYVLDDGSYRLLQVLQTPADWEPTVFPGFHLSLAAMQRATNF
jgi:Uma2 family endonuclease